MLEPLRLRRSQYLKSLAVLALFGFALLLTPSCGPQSDDDDAAPDDDDDDDSGPDDDDDSGGPGDDDDAAPSCTTCTEPCGGAPAGCYDVSSLAQCSSESVPRGLFVLVPWGNEARVNPDLLDLAHIRGTTVRSYWKDIETSPGVYDWSKMDDHFSWAAERGKTVRLAIGTGAYAPAWLIGEEDDTACANEDERSTSDLGVETVCATVPNGEFGGELRRFPLPWDATLHSQWRTLLTALVAHLEETSAAAPTPRLDSLSWIAVTGPGSHNGEVSHPDIDWLGIDLTHPVSSAPLGNTADLLSALTFTWKRALDDFDEFFGSRAVHYTLSYVFKSFPLGPWNNEADAMFKNLLRDYGVTLSSAPYFGVQSNGLDNRALWADETPESWPTAKGHWGLLRTHDTGGSTFTGMQSRGMIRLYDANENGALEDDEITPCKRGEAWQAMISNAQCLQVDVVEIYGSDASVEWDPSCDGGIRAELERLAEWLTE